MVGKTLNIHPSERRYFVKKSSVSFDFSGDGRQLYPRYHSRLWASDCPLLTLGRSRFVSLIDRMFPCSILLLSRILCFDTFARSQSQQCHIYRADRKPQGSQCLGLFQLIYRPTRTNNQLYKNPNISKLETFYQIYFLSGKSICHFIVGPTVSSAGGVSVYRDGGGGVAITAVATQPPPAAHSNLTSQHQPSNQPPPAGLVTQVHIWFHLKFPLLLIPEIFGDFARLLLITCDSSAVG